MHRIRISSLRNIIQLELVTLTVILTVLIFLGLFPNVSFDDRFLQKTGMIPYFEFRPGYPPIGKLPYYYAYIFLFQTNLYAIYMLLINGITLFLLGISMYLCLLKVNKDIALMVSFSILLMPSVIYLVFVYSRADAISIFFLICALYSLENPWISGIFCGLGALTKLYPAILLIPLFIYYKKLWKKIVLLYSFILTFLIFSLPFLVLDPLMYVSTFISHMSRGPSETIFALADGYYGHTGFLHPTFDATFYSWQFATLYEPNSLDHFRYKWKIPVLPYVSIVLQLALMIGISLMAHNKENNKDSMRLISLAVFSYFAFSTFYNPIIHIPQICFLVVAISNWDKRIQILTLAAFETVNVFHTLIWFSTLFQHIGLMLPLLIVVILRTVLYIFVLFNFIRRKYIRHS
jgi:hypothetical protein